MSSVSNNIAPPIAAPISTSATSTNQPAATSAEATDLVMELRSIELAQTGNTQLSQSADALGQDIQLVSRDWAAQSGSSPASEFQITVGLTWEQQMAALSMQAALQATNSSPDVINRNDYALLSIFSVTNPKAKSALD
ncbi:hypothetical protein [Hydrogenophaga sp.]|uniref:hypothetical protein n=1 Tax=Hydrogenophaga sp. TaxID=1904254 RepID=UPI00271A1BE2|nr:hypothetical protein [Hydrogenophaga sp.]MDO9438902.1 hypothetical protein [Hydrogenophaga sp.]